jgi:hypothetical protein
VLVTETLKSYAAVERQIMPGVIKRFKSPRHVQRFLSVNAPLAARENFGIAVARSRMLPSVRPVMRH